MPAASSRDLNRATHFFTSFTLRVRSRSLATNTTHERQPCESILFWNFLIAVCTRLTLVFWLWYTSFDRSEVSNHVRIALASRWRRIRLAVLIRSWLDLEFRSDSKRARSRM